ncbi:MAG: GIY-YIG nuclease family protein [Dehalococcoidales bacterium]|nr:GIY-YIG nuclease family protein [Dehalococcoidales bacterium]
MASYYVYIMSNRSSTLYIGVTNDLMKRVYEHKGKFVEGFTKRYAIDRLVYYESCENIESAIAREKQLKGWRRDRKIALIELVNLEWKDLSSDLMDFASKTDSVNKPIMKRGIPALHSRRGDSSLRSERRKE